jgi:hypothetical protein
MPPVVVKYTSVVVDIHYIETITVLETCVSRQDDEVTHRKIRKNRILSSCS